ncbi:unnamed protein product [Rhizoctonia solani]|uniref:Transmembrane protein n=1 Tax=Rhizoctonia solani TaxID=456999 RepID=A0A8H3AF31_9AGAM|nr:unnamed protein product [Rhizoctonia solani]
MDSRADSSRTLVAVLIRPEMWTQTTAGCVIVVLAAVLAAMWRRRRWRRTRPWLVKLRAEAASKIEKERTEAHKERTEAHKEAPKVTPRPAIIKESSDKGKEVKSDTGSVTKRAKERRRRGKDPKPTRMSTHPVTPRPSTPDDQPSSVIPHLVPLPPSPIMPPTLVLSGPTSPISTSFSISATVTTPTTSTSVSPAPTSPAFPTTTKPKLPAFPPSSPLPPNLARKPPPVAAARRSTPSINTNPGSLNRKGSYIAERKGSKETEPVEEIEFPTLNSAPKEERPKAGRKPSDVGRKDRGRKSSDSAKKTSTPESTQIASLKGALEAARLREEETAEEKRAWQKKERELQTQVNQLSHQLHALTIAFATGGGQGFPPYGYGYGTAVDPTQPTTPVMQTPGKAESTSEQEHIASISPSPAARTPSAYPGMYFAYPQFPLFTAPQPHGPPMTPQAHAPPMVPMPSPTPMMSPPPMSPPQAPPYVFSSYPWPMHRGGSPMLHGHGMNPGMNSPSGIPMNPGRHHFYSGSPRRGGSRPRRQGTGTPSTPSVGSVDDSIPLPGTEPFGDGSCSARDTFIHGKDWSSSGKDASYYGKDTTFSFHTKDLPALNNKGTSLPDSTDEYVPFRDDYVPVPPPPSGTKRDREPESDEEDDSSSSDADSDDDSVIFEDGSVSDSLNLSLRAESLRGKDKDKEVEVVRIEVGEQDAI